MEERCCSRIWRAANDIELLHVLPLQKLAKSSIGLDISAEELSTISTLWELQPFTNEDMTATLKAALSGANEQGN